MTFYIKGISCFVFNQMDCADFTTHATLFAKNKNNYNHEKKFKLKKNPFSPVPERTTRDMEKYVLLEYNTPHGAELK